ncbi:hypothetical protein CCE01nite_39690 [Cellulomonas cellasea]|uniref:Uncharacterized protein n=1 Tax=Cellulomonas cellasea TaxID=43670 RepID=A0A4Y3L4F7_9CELL|nr:hypothetical protein CCE01nite_39690 [Cellulomonas cellasea]
MAMLTMTGPSRAMNRASCANAKPTMNGARTGSVGGACSDVGTGLSWPGIPDVTTDADSPGLSGVGGLRGWRGVPLLMSAPAGDGGKTG